MHNASTAGSPSSITRTNWDALPLGEDLSHLCGGRNKHPALAGEVVEVKDDSVRPFTAAELLGDVSIG
jgi:hypothetical protein